MLRLLRLLVVICSRFFRSRSDLLLENLALRQQLDVFKQEHPQPRFAASDKLFWVMLRWLWDGWWRAFILVQRPSCVGTGQDSSRIGPGSGGIGPALEESV